MSLDSLSPNRLDRHEPIPGYVTTELIGRGGFGEVWKADAPGGLWKAIKFVHGNIDRKHASRELRSLNRIKEVRHPFLLSIERIEVIDGTLVLVTELADGNLKERYEECCVSGTTGVPRDELLAYLRDAADVLDYIYKNHSLQHLDIKPENLLLSGGRIKIADFGLIKNIYEQSTSLVDGLTPIYAPPELFAGLPNRHSDQYSLAIVYQQMLTGMLPFDGRTAAQLAAQHLQGAPALDSLPSHDRPPIARALSKNPSQRFENCVELIDALSNAKNRSPKDGKSNTYTAGTVDTALSAGSQLDVSQVRAVERSRDARGGADTGPIKPQADPTNGGTATQTTNEVSTFIHEQECNYEPTIIVGAGGTAARVMHEFCSLFQDRLGDVVGFPAIQLVLLDTDLSLLNDFGSGTNAKAHRAVTCVPTPLRNAESYRSRAPDLLRWLSRRWLYNIPRDLLTNGFRPLGRLALVDNAKRVTKALEDSIRDATNTEHAVQTTERSGLPFSHSGVQVFVVGSAAGGTGGGMALDLAYIVRAMLREKQLPEDNVHGVLLNSTPRVNKQRDKAVANAYATLTELEHYSRTGSYYPGEPSFGCPAFHGNNQTFASCHYLNLGEGLTEQQWESSAASVAEWLFCRTVTPAKQFFEQCQIADQTATAERSSEVQLRSVSVRHLDGQSSNLQSTITEELCATLVSRWKTGADKPSEDVTLALSKPATMLLAQPQTKSSENRELKNIVLEKARELGLRLETLLDDARAITARELGRDEDGYFRAIVDEANPDRQSAGDGNGPQHRADDVLSLVDSLVGCGGKDATTAESQFSSLHETLTQRMSLRSHALADRVREWVLRLVDNPQYRVDGAKYAVDRIREHLQTLATTATTVAGDFKSTALTRRKQIVAQEELGAVSGKSPARSVRRSGACEDFANDVTEYGRIRIQQTCHSVASTTLRTVDSRLTQLSDGLQGLWRELNLLSEEFQAEGSNDVAGPQETPSPAAKVANRRVRAEIDTMVEQLEGEVDRTFLNGSQKLQRFVGAHDKLRQLLNSKLRHAARRIVMRTLRDVNSEWIDNIASGKQIDGHTALGEMLTEALASQDFGGVRRQIVVVPQSVDVRQLKEHLSRGDAGPCVVRARTENAIACAESGQISVATVTERMIGNQPLYKEIAQRLHSRSDVDWTAKHVGSSERMADLQPAATQDCLV